MGKFTVSVQYERKVNLSAISSQYDNFSRSIFISQEMNTDDGQVLEEEIKRLNDLVFVETEKQIKNTFVELMKMASDTKNQALLGIGNSLEGVTDTVQIEEPKVNVLEIKRQDDNNEEDWFADGSAPVLSKKEKTVEKAVKKEKSNIEPKEVDLDSFDENDYKDLF